MKQNLLCEKTAGMRDAFCAAAEDFAGGRDHDGLEAFLTGLDALEDLLEICIRLKAPELITKPMLPALRQLHAAVHSRDIADLTDILEYGIIPAANQCLEEMEK